MQKLKNKTALITGGTSGMGKATAIDLIENGAEVIVTGRFQNTLEQTLNELGPKAKGFVSDAGKTEDRQLLQEKVKALSN